MGVFAGFLFICKRERERKKISDRYVRQQIDVLENMRNSDDVM